MTDVECLVFVRGILGKPYEVGAAGPDKFDCSGLISYVGPRAFGFPFPHFTDPPIELLSLARFVRDNPERKHWRSSLRPVHGGLVELSHAVAAHHIGLWLKFDGGGVLHAAENVGVSFAPLFRLKLEGWRSFRFWERVS